MAAILDFFILQPLKCSEKNDTQIFPIVTVFWKTTMR